MYGHVRFLTVFALTSLLVAACGRDSGRNRATAEQEVAATVEPLDPRLTADLPQGVTPAMAEQGRELFAVCSVCHGADVRGTQLGPDLRDAEWIGVSRDMEEIERVIVQGVAEPEEHPIPMPPLGGGDFDQEQVRALAAYVYAMSGDTVAAGR